MEKNNFILRINNSFARLAEWVLDHRLLIIIACLILCIGAGALSTKLRFDFDPMALNPDDSTVINNYKNFYEEFGNLEHLYILYSAKQGIFDLDILRKTQKLVKDLNEIPNVKKAQSITNLEIMEGSIDGELRKFKLEDKFPVSQAEAERLKSKILDKPLFVNTYISKDAEFAAILCEMEDIPYQREIRKSIKSILAKPDYKDFTFYPVGDPLNLAAIYDLTEENIILFGALSSIFVIMLLTLLFRQIKGVVSPYIIVLNAVVLVLGFMVINDLPITIFFSIIPSALLAVGIADAVHVISEYQIHLKSGNDNRTSILKAVKLVAFPCLFTSLTTAIGFASLGTSSISAIRNFGLTLAFGVIAAFIITFTILLLILSVSGAKTEAKFKNHEQKKGHGFMDHVLLQIAHLSIRNYKMILFISAIISIILIYGVTKIQINTSTLVAIGDKIQLFKDYKFVDKTMGGTASFEVLLDSKKADGIKTLQFVHTLEKIQHFAESQDYLVKNTISIVDILKETNRALNVNNKAFYRLPSSDGAELQNINEFLYELSGVDELERIVSEDLAKARLTIFVESSDSSIYNRFYEDFVSFIESIKPAGYSYTITGISFSAVSSMRNMTSTMVKSLGLAILLISLMMIIVFRSFKIGLLSMIPNIFPVLFALGFMGLTDIWLSHVTSITGCIVIGLAVDDTIHFISRYRMEFDRLGNYRKALTATMTGVGHALTITTVILVIGFGVFMVSRMDHFFHSGLLSAVCFTVALLADFFIAPALILVFKPFGKEFTPIKNNMEERNYKTGEKSLSIS